MEATVLKHKWLRFGEGATGDDKCKICREPATGIVMIGGFFPMFSCDAHAEELRKKEQAALEDDKNEKFALQEFLA